MQIICKHAVRFEFSLRSSWQFSGSILSNWVSSVSLYSTAAQQSRASIISLSGLQAPICEIAHAARGVADWWRPTVPSEFVNERVSNEGRRGWGKKKTALQSLSALFSFAELKPIDSMYEFKRKQKKESKHFRSPRLAMPNQKKARSSEVLHAMVTTKKTDIMLRHHVHNSSGTAFLLQAVPSKQKKTKDSKTLSGQNSQRKVRPLICLHQSRNYH